MFYHKVIHKYRLDTHFEIKEIGLFDSYDKAKEAVDKVKNKPGFIDYQDYFITKRILKLFKPRLLNNVYWVDGFDTYYFHRKSNVISCDEEKYLMKYLSFLLTEYNFKFDKLYLGDMVDENGKLWFYGPYNCYYFYNGNICINFLNLVQKGDWYIYITKDMLSDQNQIVKGKQVPTEYCYDLSLFVTEIKDELKYNKTIFAINIEQ